MVEQKVSNLLVGVRFSRPAQKIIIEKDGYHALEIAVTHTVLKRFRSISAIALDSTTMRLVAEALMV